MRLDVVVERAIVGASETIIPKLALKNSIEEDQSVIASGCRDRPAISFIAPLTHMNMAF